MPIEQQLLDFIDGDRISFRSALEDPAVMDALSSIGVSPRVLALHAPSEGAKKADGLGVTLCGIRGTRYRIVSCERCRGRQARGK